MKNAFLIPESPIQPVWKKHSVVVDMLREDLNHPLIQGNKFRKLIYNIQEAKQLGHNTLLTFGGAYSNHIHATAAAGKAFGFHTVGIIRGEELQHKALNPTLKQASEFGMRFRFVSREIYRQKDSASFIANLKAEFPDAFILPEGGTNEAAVKGCAEILDERTTMYDYICVPVGTAGTISGLIRASRAHQTVLGFPALKSADFLHDVIASFTPKTNYKFINTYHFGGYARFSSELITFVNSFSEETGILLDPVYTAKMMYGLNDMIERNHFKAGSRILAVHTGGLQGLQGFEERHGKLIKT